MKTMTCKELGGACDLTFSANTFEEITEQSKAHGMEMFQKNDADHLKAIQEMMQLMQQPEEMAKWFKEKQQIFENLADD